MANPTLKKNFLAEAAVVKHRIVKFGADDDHVLQGAAVGDFIFGVSDLVAAAAAEERMDVIVAGIADIEFGGTIVRGGRVTTDATGRAVAAAPAVGVNNRIIGFAWVSGVIGDIAPVLLAPGEIQGP